MTELRTLNRPGGLIVVLSGPSGVGKDTLLQHFLNTTPGCVRLVTCTTRPRRPDERDGVDYQFVSVEEFRRMQEAGELLESAEVFGHHYGSPRKFVEEKTARGLDVILRIDVQGGVSVRKAAPGAVLVFLAPPSFEELERRLRGRNTETAASIARRLAEARREMEAASEYDYLIVHDSTERAAEDLRAVLRAEHLRIVRAS
jgi:guanylate kinase